jgi:hypothetical protein
MLTNSADLGAGELGWGFKSFAKGLAKGVGKVGKGVVKTAVVNPTKIAAKSAYSTGKGVTTATGQVAKGKFTSAGKSLVKAGLAPVKGGVAIAKQASKAVTDLALYPVRSRLTTLKNRRANLLAFQARGSKTPTTIEKAQARKDVKSMLSKQGPHGKMLSWLAGPEYNYDGLGVVGYDDAALAAIATALTATAARILTDAAKSKFAPVDAAKAGGAAAAATAVKAAAGTSAGQKIVAAKEIVEETAALEPTEPVTSEEVAAEPVVEAEEAAVEEETSNVEGALAGFGMLEGFRGVAEEAAAPAAMDESTAKQVGSAAQRIVCGMSAPALNAIGGVSAVKVAGSLCAAVSAGDDTSVRRLLPAAVQIAARATNVFAADAFRMGYMNEGGLPAAGFGGPLEDLKKRRGKKGKMKRYLELSGLQGITADDLGRVAAFAGASPDELAFGLAGVDSTDLQAGQTAATGSNLVLVPSLIAVAAGLWIAFKG